MRAFHSHGPVNSKRLFCVKRKMLVEKCYELIGDLEEGGHVPKGPECNGLADSPDVSIFNGGS